MSETALNFGPDWIRALATGSTSAPCPTSMSIPRYSLAEFRYGREEMLALIPKDVKVPSSLQHFPHLSREHFQIPLALTPVSEEEQRLAARSVNSEAALRASGKGGYGMSRPGRGGSVDRGRGRGRGGFYQRGLMHEDSEDMSFSRPRTLERSSSATEKDHRWDERDRRYDRPFSSARGGYDDTNLKHDNMRGPNEHWRKYDKEEEGGWRTTGSRSYDKLGGRPSWRNSPEYKDSPDKNAQNRHSAVDTKGGAGPQHKPGNLPEWSVEETVEPDAVGTFDSSGAFLETKVSEEDASYNKAHALDGANDGISQKDSPEAVKEAPSKSPPKKPAGSSAKQSANKKNSKSSEEVRSTDGTQAKNIPESPKSNSNNSSRSQTSKTVETVIRPNNSTVEKQQDRQVKKDPDLSAAAHQRKNVKSSKIESVILDNVRNSAKVSTPGAGMEEDTFAHHEKATEHMVAQWTEEIEQRVPPQTAGVHPKHEKDTKWFYQDPQGETQGPFTSPEMFDWFSAGYFTMDLMVRRSCDEQYSQLGDLIKSWGHVPFMSGSSPPPPSKVKPMKSVASQPNVPEPILAAAAAAPSLPKQDDQLLALQQQLFQQQLMQQQLMLRQAQMQQFISQLKQQDNFASLNAQQQQLVMQQYMAQMPRPDSKPMAGQSSVLDSLPPLSLPMMGMSMPSMMKTDHSMWPVPPDTGMWSANLPSQPPGGSIWDADVTKPKTEEADLERQKKLAEDHERMRKAEELRLQKEKELGEKRKQEELKKKQEEEERKRLEELKQEEDRKRQEMEERRRKEEEEQRKRELEEKRRQQEELKRQDKLRESEIQELKRKEEQARQDELKRQQELRKMEEKRKKDEQKRIQLEKEQEKQQEIESQKEALRHKEMEREDRLQREKREREESELRRLAELKLISQGPVWGIQNSQPNVQLSLADIQRLQEEKDREEKEEKMRQQLLQQQVVKQVQQNKNGLTWAKRANDCQSVVKSLSEIQQEEVRQIAQQNRMQKPQAPTPAVNYNAGVWGNSSHLNKITAAPTNWNSNSVSAGGFWEEALHTTTTTQVRKQPPKANNADSAFPALAIPAQPVTVSSHKNKNNRAKKEEDALARLFGSHHKPTDEFTKWCTDAISAMPSSVDVPTFVAFLKDIESPYEVYDYVKSYLGEGKEPKEFAKLFLEKRSKFRNQAKQVLDEDNSLWGPAPAITPTKKTVVPTTNENDGNSNTKGKTRKRKGKMQKLDSSMLGFTVQPNPDRLNAAGEIERIENM